DGAGAGDIVLIAGSSRILATRKPGSNALSALNISAPANINLGSPVNLSGYASDSDGTIAMMEWDVDGDGLFELSISPETPSAEGWFNITAYYNDTHITRSYFRVQDSFGEYNISTLNVTVKPRINQRPVANAKISTSLTGAQSNSMEVYEGQEFYIFSNGSYDPDGTIISYSWNLGNGTFIDVGLDVNLSVRINATGTYIFVLKAIDNDGAESDTSNPLSKLSVFVKKPSDPSFVWIYPPQYGVVSGVVVFTGNLTVHGEGRYLKSLMAGISEDSMYKVIEIKLKENLSYKKTYYFEYSWDSRDTPDGDYKFTFLVNDTMRDFKETRSITVSNPKPSDNTWLYIVGSTCCGIILLAIIVVIVYFVFYKPKQIKVEKTAASTSGTAPTAAYGYVGTQGARQDDGGYASSSSTSVRSIQYTMATGCTSCNMPIEDKAIGCECGAKYHTACAGTIRWCKRCARRLM
ncbi:MAG: PKD domain-containing protein, partial [Thermoplasmata archaeon]